MDLSPHRAAMRSHTPPSTPSSALQETSKLNTSTDMASPLTTPPKSSSTYLSRKAHKFSSLKKKKPATASLLNKLFCNSPPFDSDSNSIITENSQLPVKEEDQEKGCVHVAMSEAVSSLKLDNEASVRDTIHRSMLEAQAKLIDVVCSGDKQDSSPPTHTVKTEQGEELLNPPRPQGEGSMSPPRPQGEGSMSPPRPQGEGSMSPSRPPRFRTPYTPSSGPQGPRTVSPPRPSSVIKAEHRDIPSFPHQPPGPLHVSPPRPSSVIKAEHRDILSFPHRRSIIASALSDETEDDDKKDDDSWEDAMSSSVSVPLRVLDSSTTSPTKMSASKTLRTYLDRVITTANSPINEEKLDFDAPSSRIQSPTTPSGHDKFQTPQENDDAFLPDDFELGVAPPPAPTPTPLRAPPPHPQEPSPASSYFAWSKVQERLIEAVGISKGDYLMQQQQQEQHQSRFPEEQSVEVTEKQWTEEQVQVRIASALSEAKEQWQASSTGNLTSKHVADRIAFALDDVRNVEEIDERIAKAVAAAREEWKAEQESQIEMVLSEYKQMAETTLQEHGLQWERNHRAEIEQIQSKYEVMMSKQRDKAIMAKHLAKQHQVEVDEMEEKLVELQTSVSVDSQREKEELARVARELESAKQRLIEQEAQIEKMETLRKELFDKNRFLDAAHLKRMQLEKEKDEQLASVKQMQDQVMRSTSAATLSPVRSRLLEIGLLQKDFEDLQVQHDVVSPRSKEIAELRRQLDEMKNEKDQKIAELRKQLAAADRDVHAHSSNSNSPLVQSLKKEVDRLQKEKEIVSNRAEDDLRHLKDQLELIKETDSQSSTKEQEQIASLQQEIQQVKREKEHEAAMASANVKNLEQQLAFTERELANAREHAKDVSKIRSPNRSKDATESMIKAKQELASLRREIDQLGKQKDREVSALQRDLKAMEDALAQKDKDIAQKDRELSLPKVGTPSRNVPGSPGRMPGTPKLRGTPSRGTRRDSIGNDEHVQKIDLLEKEKEMLREQISVLESQILAVNRAHEKALAELRSQSERDLSEIKREMELRVEKHMQTERQLKDTLSTVDSIDKEELMEKIEQLEADKRAERSGGLREVQKKEELLLRIAALEKKEQAMVREQEVVLQDLRNQSDAEIRRLHNEIAKHKAESLEKERELQLAISETESFEKEELLQRIDKLEAKLENEQNSSVLVKMKATTLEKESKAAVEAHHEEVLRLRTKHADEVARLRQQLLELSAVEEAMQIASNEKEALEEDARHAKAVLHQERIVHHDKLEALRKENAEKLDALRKESARKLAEAERDTKQRIRILEEIIEQLRKEKEDAERRSGLSSEDEKRLRDELATVKAREEFEKKRCESQLQALKLEHAKESEEMLVQLDLVEAEHQDKVDEIMRRAGEKDAIITALGSQLADAQARLKRGEESRKNVLSELERSTAELNRLRPELDAAKTELSKMREAHTAELSRLRPELEAAKTELSKMREAHAQYMESAEAAKEEACEAARDEMIERAEEQFKLANGLYVKLKKQYDLCKSKLDNVELELKESKASISVLETYNVDLKAQIAELAAAHAKEVAELSRKSKEYRREMEGLLTAAEEFEKKHQAAEASSRHAYKKLATVISQKDILQREHDEMKTVCEELMSMVEQGQQQQRHHA